MLVWKKVWKKVWTVYMISYWPQMLSRNTVSGRRRESQCLAQPGLNRPMWHSRQQKNALGASLVAQWLRICLPVQGTRVRALVREHPTCRGATEPVCHDYWACALEPASHNYWAHESQLLKPVRLEPVLRHKRSHWDEKPAHRNEE